MRLMFLIIFSVSTLLAKPLIASEEAMHFVQEKVNRVLDVLADPSMDENKRIKEFENEILQIADVNVIARFVLGPYAAKASPAQVTLFTRAFQDYALGVYRSELDDFGHEVIQIHETKERKPGDSIVYTTIAGGAVKNKPREIKWRIITINNEPRVVDIEISGVWISQHQRAEITGVIARNGGNINAATKMLCAQTTGCKVTG